MNLPPAPSEPRSAGNLPVVAIVLGVLAALTGIGGNSGLVLLGIVAVGLGVWARRQDSRTTAIWGIVIAILGVLGYFGSLTQTS